MFYVGLHDSIFEHKSSAFGFEQHLTQQLKVTMLLNALAYKYVKICARTVYPFNYVKDQDKMISTLDSC
jgi:hypothetical protein